MAKAGLDNGDQEDDNESMAEFLSGDEGEEDEDEGGDANMVTKLFGGNLPEPTGHASDGTARKSQPLHSPKG